MDNKILPCKDCRHSTMSIIDGILTFGGRVGVHDVNYKCTKFPEAKTVIEDMVLGLREVKAKLPHCQSVRRYGECGLRGKHWAPKYKRDLFKMLTREYND